MPKLNLRTNLGISE